MLLDGSSTQHASAMDLGARAPTVSQSLTVEHDSENGHIGDMAPCTADVRYRGIAGLLAKPRRPTG